MTRRVVNPQPKTQVFNACPYGQPGDLLWARETWGVGSRPCPINGDRQGVEYKADLQFLHDERDLLPLYEVNPPDDVDDLMDFWRDGWRPSIHMPRWASRLTLRITNVGVERLQEISEDDAAREGVAASLIVELKDGSPCYSFEFQQLWTRMYGIDNPKAWDSNPWVWIVSFEVINANVDKFLEEDRCQK